LEFRAHRDLDNEEVSSDGARVCIFKCFSLEVIGALLTGNGVSVIMVFSDCASSKDQYGPDTQLTGVHPMERKVPVCAALLFAVILAAVVPVYGQDDGGNEGRFIFRNSTVALSTFFAEIAPSTYISSVDGSATGWTNISGGFILNNRFSISLFVALSRTAKEFLYEGEQVFLTYRQTGLKFGYLHRTDRMLFWRANLAVGLGGGYQITEDNSLLGSIFGSWTYRATVFSLEPSLGVGFNLLPWWRLYVDLGYRFMGPNDAVVPIADDDTITLMISFGFGNFKYRQPEK
jgi:hypothetical protein